MLFGAISVLLNIILYLFVIVPTYNFMSEPGVVSQEAINALNRSETINGVVSPIVLIAAVLAVLSLVLGLILKYGSKQRLSK